jgi:hypothetical protein
MSMMRMSAKADCASILVAFVLGAVGMPAAAAFESPWSIAPIEPATLDEASRALWWNESIGVVFGSRGTSGPEQPTVDSVHVGSAWRLPLEHRTDLTLRTELLGTRESIDAWRSGATWSLDLSPNASINASAWWTAPQDGVIGGSATIDGEGSALVGFTLRF